MFTELLFFISDRFLDPEVFWGTPILLAILYSLLLFRKSLRHKTKNTLSTEN